MFSAGCSERCTWRGRSRRRRPATATRPPSRSRPGDGAHRMRRHADPGVLVAAQQPDSRRPPVRVTVTEAQLRALEWRVPVAGQPAAQVAGVEQGQPDPGLGGAPAQRLAHGVRVVVPASARPVMQVVELPDARHSRSAISAYVARARASRSPDPVAPQRRTCPRARSRTCRRPSVCARAARGGRRASGRWRSPAAPGRSAARRPARPAPGRDRPDPPVAADLDAHGRGRCVVDPGPLTPVRRGAHSRRAPDDTRERLDPGRQSASSACSPGSARRRSGCARTALPWRAREREDAGVMPGARRRAPGGRAVGIGQQRGQPFAQRRVERRLVVHDSGDTTAAGPRAARPAPRTASSVVARRIEPGGDPGRDRVDPVGLHPDLAEGRQRLVVLGRPARRTHVRA